jgi:hypothetical protein
VSDQINFEIAALKKYSVLLDLGKIVTCCVKKWSFPQEEDNFNVNLPPAKTNPCLRVSRANLIDAQKTELGQSYAPD